MSKPIRAIGVDAGFRKTGVALFDLRPKGDVLVAADTLVTSKETASDRLNDDVDACWNLYTNIETFMIKYEPSAAFIEMPHGGAQGARANRCMGMATAVMASLFNAVGMPYEMFAPTEVEKALGVFLTNKQAREMGIPKGKTGKHKKDRLKSIVLAEFPDFDGWPKAVTRAEDAYDAAAVFHAARFRGSELYLKLRRKVSGGQAG